MVISNSTNVIFDCSANLSFVSPKFVHKLDRLLVKLNNLVEFKIADGKTVLEVDVCKNFDIVFGNRSFKIELILMTLGEFDVNVGMDWLDRYRADISLHEKFVLVKTPSMAELIIHGEKWRRLVRLCTYERARRLLCGGSMAFLAHVVDIREEPPSIRSILVVKKFEDVFSNEIPGFPLERQVEFRIELVPEATPTAKTP
ncbi:uncharacterized protein [Rutidosis leptorrhynchoides]|uniref:uncharacterized protein n=1 Tax=Rutidosis leptorrhynchoides TaxID=125765 RepID=UPI003A9901B6